MKRSPLIILFVTLFIDLLGFGLILPNIPIYIRHYGGSSTVGGILMACFSIAQFVSAPIWGRASDKYGRRPLILMSLLGSAFSYFFFGAAGSLTVLFIARIAAGVLTSASLPTSQAYIADVTPPEKRAGGMALLGMAFGLGFAFGPWIGGELSKFSIFGQPPLATPAYFAAALSLVNFVWALIALPESHFPNKAGAHVSGTPAVQEEKGLFDVFPAIFRAMRNPLFSAQLLVFAFATFAFAAVESSFSWLVLLRFDRLLGEMAAQNWQQSHTGQLFSSLSLAEQKHLIEATATHVSSTIFGIVGVTILFVQGAVMSGLARKVGEHRLAIAGSAILTGALIGIALAPTIPIIQMLSACIAIGNGLLNPSLSALITHAAGPNDRGLISGAQQGLGSLARIIAPPVNNYMIGKDTRIPFLSSAVLMFVAFLLALRLKPLPDTSTLSQVTEHPGHAPAEATEISHP